MSTSKKELSILIPDGENHLLIFIVNCLSKYKNIKIYVISNKRVSQMRYSRYVHKYIYHEHRDDIGNWLNKIDETVSKYNIDLVVPIFEYGIEDILTNIDGLKNKNKLCLLPSLSSLLIAGNKGDLYEYLVDFGFSCPNSFIVKSGQNVIDAHNLNFPLIAKPVKGFGGGTGFYVLKSESELNGLFSKTNFDYDFIIQEFIEGYDICANVLCIEGEVKAFSLQKEIELPKKRFAPQLGIQFVDDEELLDIAKTLMKQLNWSGIANIDFRYDANKKDFKIIEINPRFWYNVEASALANINFPFLLCKASLNGDLKEEQAELKKILSLKGLAKTLSINPMGIFKFRFILQNTPLVFILKDPIPTIYKFVWRTKNLILLRTKNFLRVQKNS